MRFSAALVISAMATPPLFAQVETGLDALLADQLDLVSGKSVGIVCNHTAVTRDGEHIADRLAREEDVTVAALFGPEHGIRGTANAGARIQNDESEAGIPVYSLYDGTGAPTSAELEGLDLVIYDIQDVGARYYTYISTLGAVIDACAENGVPVMVLDRPNPVTGLHAEGPIREPQFSSFVGRYPIPVRYSLTPGEIAQMMVGERWTAGADGIELTVIPCRGWRRDMDFDATGLTFVRPSPNIPSVEGSFVYLATCYFEGTNVSEGRGTDTPFMLIGAPWIDAERWVEALEGCELEGVSFTPATFTPEPNAGSSNPKLNGEECHGVEISVTDRETFRPVRTGLAMLWMLQDLHSAGEGVEGLEVRASFNRLWGTDEVHEALIGLGTGGATHDEWRRLADSWEGPVAAYWELAQPYLLYE